MKGLDPRVVAQQLDAVLREAVEGASGPTTFFVDNRAHHGLFGAIADLDAARASRVVGSRSIAAHVHHIVFAMEASAAWMNGDRTPRDWSTSWQVDVLNGEAWAALVDRLRAEYGNLRTAIEYSAGTDDAAFIEAVGAVAHVAYHLGSIWQKVGLLEQKDNDGVACW
jgi:hypothetical protein